MRLSTLLFRAALLAYPGEWRRRYGEEAVDAFRRGFGRRREGAVPGSAGGFALQAVWDAVWDGVRERARLRSRRRGRGGDGIMETLRGDIRYAVRRLRRSPGFTLAVLSLLALGVGANSAVFTVLRATVLTPPPFPEAERLVLPRLTAYTPGQPDTTPRLWSYAKFREFRDGTRDAFDLFAGYAYRNATVTGPGDAEALGFEYVTPDYFPALGLVPVLGRFFREEDDDPASGSDAVVLSHALWTQRFGGDPEVVGRTLQIYSGSVTVVGVAPEGFRGLTGAARFWLPAGQAGNGTVFGPWIVENRSAHWMNAVARLAPEVALEQARLRSLPVAEAVEAPEPSVEAPDVLGMAVTPLGEVWTGEETRASLWLAMGAALLVLSIAIANLAALLVARGRRETRETAVRLALGAHRLRLVRERMTESVLLALAGGGIGLLLAGWSMGAIRGALPSDFFRGGGGDLLRSGREALAVDPLVAGFGLVVALVAGVVFGVGPALSQSGIDLLGGLRGGASRGSTARGDGRRLLLAGQVSLSVLLLVGAGLLLGTLQRLHQEQRGFDPEGLLVLRYTVGGIGAPYTEDQARGDFHREYRDRLAALPGVRSTAVGTVPPLGGHYWTSNVTQVVGEPPFPPGREVSIGGSMVEGRVFETLGTRLLAGRTFTEEEERSAEMVTVLSETAAQTLFPGEDPLGREIRVGISFEGDGPGTYRVVGVVEDVLYSHPTEGMMPELYLPTGLWSPPGVTLFVRTGGEPRELLPAARRILAEMDGRIAFGQVVTGDELRRQDVADTQLLAWVLGVFAGLALVLSAAGLWAVVAQAVAERRREIGVRIALGARRGAVEGLVFRQGFLPILTGGAVGVALAVVLAPRVSVVLFGIGPRDPLVFTAAGVVLVAVGLLATWLPARRAARVHPVEVLAGE